MQKNSMDINASVTLNNGIRIPVVGLGVFRSPPGKTTRRAIQYAFEAGYRHIDTAYIYGNESDVGKAVAKSGIPREEVFVTTKLWNAHQGFDSTLKACEASLRKMKLDFVDLYLMHWPVKDLRLESWKAMERLLAGGKCRSIGVRNFMVDHLEELMKNSGVVPAVNQIELSPYNYLQHKELIGLCQSLNIVIEAYSPLTKGRKLDDPALAGIARKYHKTSAQLLIRWALEKGFVVLPKSVNRERIIENVSVFDFSISPEDMQMLDAFNENLVTGWDPTLAP